MTAVEKPGSGYDITDWLLRLAVRIVDTYGTGGARRNAWRAMQADAQRAQDRAEVEHMLAALDLASLQASRGDVLSRASR
jgi:hypothetical protein